MRATIKQILIANNKPLTFFFCLSCKKCYKVSRFDSTHNLSHGYCEVCGIKKLAEIKKEIRAKKENNNAI